MNAFLFGVCGCCNGLSGEAQTAYAYAPYWMGTLGLDQYGQVANNPLGTAFAQTIPPMIYLTMTTEYCDDAGNVLNTYTNSYTRLGVLLPNTGTAGWPDNYGGNRIARYKFSDPYTYQEAVDFALQLLDTIELLNPNKTYPVTSTDEGR